MIINGYLTSNKLNEGMKSILPTCDWLGAEISKIDGKSRYRYDFGFINNNIKYLVEFDGETHYRDPGVIFRDTVKTSLAKDNGYKLIRIPYWVQLTTQTIKHYFNIDHEVRQDYKHGFIDKKCMLPASFCEHGIERFLMEIMELPLNIKLDIIDSFIEKVKTHHNMCWVIPKTIQSEFRYLINERVRGIK